MFEARRRQRLRGRKWTGVIAAVWWSALVVALAAGCAPAAPSVSGRVPSAAPLASEPTVVAQATALPAAAAGWKTYTDTALGYSISYPDDAEFTSGSSTAGVYTARLQFRIPGVDGYQGLVLRVEPNPTRAGIEQIAQEIYRRTLVGDSPVSAPAQMAPVTVNALSGTQLGDGGDFSLVIPYEDYVYIIAPVHDFAATSLDSRALALFYQVLATLEIAR